VEAGSVNYYERHIGDYLKDTAHLSLLEHGVYTRLLDVYYTREGEIPETDVARLVGARTKEEKAALATVLAEFFELRIGGYGQARCDREIERLHDKRRKASASASARWQKSERNANASETHMRTNSERNANAMQETCEGNARAPVPRHQTPDTNTPPNPRKRGNVHEFPPGFDRFWLAYPKKVGKDAAARAFAKRKPDAALVDAMVAAVERQRVSDQWRKDGGQFIPNPATWLNEGRWLDEQPESDSIFARSL
jgi:uncharacterized protein YdaU (DUF1376 family)